MNKQTCKFVKENGEQCKGFTLFPDGMCMWHSKTEEAEEVREKGKESKKKALVANKKFRLPSPNQIQQIRRNCLDCVGNQASSVMFCFSVDCQLWYLRFGKKPKSVVREKGKDYAGLFDKDNFREGGKYDAHTVVNDLRV